MQNADPRQWRSYHNQMQLQRAINIIYHVIRTAVIRWLLADKKSIVSRYVFIRGGTLFTFCDM